MSILQTNNHPELADRSLDAYGKWVLDVYRPISGPPQYLGLKWVECDENGNIYQIGKPTPK